SAERSPSHAEKCGYACKAQFLCARRSRSSRFEGAVNINTSTATTGVTTRDIKNVPKKPMRRWLPQSPTRRAKATYRTTAITGVIGPCLRSPAPLAPAGPSAQACGGLIRRRHALVAAALLPAVVCEAELDLSADAAPLVRAFHFSFCALMNSR